MTGIVYKYTTAATAIDHILGAGSIRFTPPSELNDPFDGGPDFGVKFIDEIRLEAEKLLQGVEGPDLDRSVALELLTEKLLTQPRRVAVDRAAGVLSLTKRPDGLLMWAHYADNHRGIVIGFDAAHDFFNPGAGIGIEGLRDVEYVRQRPLTPITMHSENEISSKDDAAAISNALFFSKSVEWQYEQEVRVLRMAMQPPDSLIKGVVSFPPALVREIIIGVRMPLEKVREVYRLHESQYNHASLLVATMDFHSFQVNIRPAPAAVFMDQLRRSSGRYPFG